MYKYEFDVCIDKKYSDYPDCREQGAALTTSEMVSAKALVYRDEKTRSLLYGPPDEHPYAGADGACGGESA